MHARTGLPFGLSFTHPNVLCPPGRARHGDSDPSTPCKWVSPRPACRGSLAWPFKTSKVPSSATLRASAHGTRKHERELRCKVRMVTNASSIAMSLAHVQSVLCCGLALTCACDQHRRVGKAITSPIAGTVLATSSVALVLAPSPWNLPGPQRAAGWRAGSGKPLVRGAFERGVTGVGIATANP